MLAAAIERLHDLNVGTMPVDEGAPHEKPHKPLLLLAIYDHQCSACGLRIKLPAGNDVSFIAAGKDEFLMRTPWDLVVIDEAHRLRNVHKSNNINARKLRTALHNSRI